MVVYFDMALRSLSTVVKIYVKMLQRYIKRKTLHK